MVPSPCDVETSESVSKFFHRRFPNLRNLSIFLYGPPSHDEEYANMLGHLQNVYVQRISITMNALELPEAYFVRNATLPSLPYTDGRVRVVVSSTRPGCFISYQKAIEWENPRVEDDTWITGSLWLGPLHEADATLKLLTYCGILFPLSGIAAAASHEFIRRIFSNSLHIEGAFGCRVELDPCSRRHSPLYGDLLPQQDDVNADMTKAPSCQVTQ